MQSQVKYGLNSTRIHDSQPHTAVKSSYQDQSPSRFINGTPSQKSHSRCVSKIQEARESINLMINEMTHKRNSNNEAVEYVRGVNNEVLGALQGGNTRRRNLNQQNQRGHEHPRQPSRGNEGNEYRRGSGDFNFGDNEHPDVFPNVPYQRSLEQENIELRRCLDQQMRQNNQLIRRIRYLQAQNADLRGRLGHLNNSKNMRSTNHNSVFDFTSQPYSARNQRQNERNLNYGHHQQTSNFGGFNNNRNSMNNFGRIESPLSLQNQNDSNLMAQLDELKYENERLRQEAVDLLKHY